MSPRTSAQPGHSRRTRWIEQQSPAWFAAGVVVVRFMLRHWVRYFRSVGEEHLPAEGGVFLIANHASATDPFVLGYPVRHRHPHGPGKVELFANPVMGYMIRKIGMFPIRQHSADAGAVRAMVELYRKGELVIVYPEGGRSDDGHLQPFFPDFARLMIRMKARMLPAGIAGGHELLPVGALFPRRNTPVAVSYGEPFELSEFYDRPLDDALIAEAAEVLRTRVAEQMEIAGRERELLLAARQSARSR